MSEQTMRRRVVQELRCLHALPVENRVQAGTPDVNCTEGWIELKWVRRWPIGINTPLTIPHYTQHQRNWLRRRWLAGGGSWLLLQVGREWLLFDGLTAAERVGRAHAEELHKLALTHWVNGLKKDELAEALRNHKPKGY